jgi:hypothetical protein
VAVLGEPGVEPAAEAGNGREGGVGLEVAELGGELLNHAFDEEVAETDAGEAALAVADGVEDGGVGLARVEHGFFFVEQTLDAAGEALGEGDLDEDQGLGGHAGVEEGVAAAV